MLYSYKTAPAKTQPFTNKGVCVCLLHNTRLYIVEKYQIIYTNTTLFWYKKKRCHVDRVCLSLRSTRHCWVYWMSMDGNSTSMLRTHRWTIHTNCCSSCCTAVCALCITLTFKFPPIHTQHNQCPPRETRSVCGHKQRDRDKHCKYSKVICWVDLAMQRSAINNRKKNMLLT